VRARPAKGGWPPALTTGSVGCFPILSSWEDVGEALLAGLSSLRGIVVLAPWLVFVVAVIWMSRQVRKRPLTAWDSRGSRLMVAQYTLFFTAFVHSLLFWRLQVSAVAAFIGMVLVGTGAAVYFSVLPHLARGYNPMVCVRRGQQLCTGGPYRLVRHPSYLGQMLMMLGTALVTQHYDYGVIPVIFYIMFRTAKAEEALLTEHFAGYAEYRRRTWMFVPHVL